LRSRIVIYYIIKPPVLHSVFEHSEFWYNQPIVGKHQECQFIRVCVISAETIIGIHISAIKEVEFVNTANPAFRQLVIVAFDPFVNVAAAPGDSIVRPLVGFFKYSCE